MGNQLEEIQKLYAKPKEYKIPKVAKEGEVQATIIIHPLGMEDMSTLDMNENAPMSEITKNAISLFAKSLKVKEEVIGKLSFTFMKDLTEAIMDVNNFKEEDFEKTGVNKFLEEKRKLAKKESVDGNKSTEEA